MSRNIRNDHKFTDEERQYLTERCQHDLIAANDAGDYASEPEPQEEPTLHLDKDIYDKVVAMEMPELQQELRNLGQTPAGDERELRTVLASILQNQRNATPL